jgi:adenylate kinase family enzyme
MLITIIGPPCSGKSTLAFDMAAKIKNANAYEEAFKIFKAQGATRRKCSKHYF